MKYLLIIISSLGCLVVLGYLWAFVVLAKRGSSRYVHQSTSARFKPSWREKLFRWGALLGLYVCVYGGVYLLFAWIPESMGYEDESGKWRSSRMYLSFAISFFLFIQTMEFMNEAILALFELRSERERSKVLERIAKASGDKQKYTKIRVELESKMAVLSDKMYKENTEMANHYKTLTGKEIIMYQEILDLLNCIDEPEQSDLNL